MSDNRHQDEALNRFWNDLSDAGGDPAAADLDPAQVKTLRQLHAMTRLPPPAAARTRVDRAMRERLAVPQNGKGLSTMNQTNALVRGPLASDPTGWARWQSAGRIAPETTPRAARWAGGQFATVLLLLITLAVGLAAVGPWRPGSSPPAGDHRLAAITQEPATPAASLEDLPALAEFIGEIALDPNGTDASNAAAGVAIAADGTVYVIDARNDQIRVFDRAGTPVATWGESGDGPGQFTFLGAGTFYGDLAIGPDSNLYVMDTGNSRVQVLTPEGTYLREWGESGSEEAQFLVPSGIALDEQGRVYVTETGNRRLQIFDSEGQFVAAWEPSEAEGGPFLDPGDVAIDAAGVVSVTDYVQNRVFRFDAQGAVLDRIGIERQYRVGEVAEPGYLSQPWGAAVDPQGNLYVAEYRGRRVQVFAPDGTSLGVIEAVETERDQSPFPRLMYLTISPDGILYVADNANGRVQVFRLLPPLVETPSTLVLD